MAAFICRTCGTQYADNAEPPSRCAICSDERQYVGWQGQGWTTHAELAAHHRARIERDGDLLGIGITPAFGIPQRLLHVPAPGLRVMWECTSLVTAEAVAALQQAGGVDAIAISHPHFYAAMVEWSQALGGVPVWLHEADRQWVQRPAPQLRCWSGDRLALSDPLTLYRCPGHFPGSTVLHWRGGPRGRDLLLAGDALHVAQDRRHVSFCYSVPNHVPAHPDDVAQTQARLAGLAIDDVYGFTWGLNILGQGRAAVDRSFERYWRAIGR